MRLLFLFLTKCYMKVRVGEIVSFSGVSVQRFSHLVFIGFVAMLVVKRL